MVTLKGATFGWEVAEPIHSSVSLTVERGMRLAILGPNGAGKSTLLWALAGKLKLAEGERCPPGHPVPPDRAGVACAWRPRRIMISVVVMMSLMHVKLMQSPARAG